jgi:hypothetical protein
MTVLFAAIRTIAFATVFVWLWAMVGLWARQFDPIFGGPLPSWTWPLGVAVLMAGVPLALTCTETDGDNGKTWRNGATETNGEESAFDADGLQSRPRMQAVQQRARERAAEPLARSCARC